MEKNTTTYRDIVQAIVEASKGFEEIEPQIHNMFLDSLNIFNKAVQTVYVEGTSLDAKDYKLKIFEKMFSIDIESELSKMVEDIVINGFEKPEDINNKNVDEDLLANIKKNIQNYLKD